MQSIDTIIKTRRSHFVKEFTGQILPDSLVDRMLDNAGWAPSHKLTFPWRFRIFSGDEKLSLCEKMEQFYLENTPAEKFSQQKLDKIRTYKNKVSHIISIGMEPTGMVPEWEELAATAMAVQNMYLTIVEDPCAAGYWTTGNGTGSDTMRDYTGLSAQGKQLGFFMLGWVQDKRMEAAR